MRILRVLPLILAAAVIGALNHSFSPAVPAIGRVIDPVNGAMANAEDWNEDWDRNLHLKDLQAPVQIWLDTSLIPHLRAGNDRDLYYAQGYIHATFRLWQMDLQTRAAWGRVSEVAGPKAIDFDRGMRREGMVWGAQHSLETMEADPRTRAMLDAYRDGINAYIHTLNFRALPIEYKLMGFYPEDWTNLRTALLMKYMARDLTGKTDDIAYTQLRDQLGQQEFDFLFPERIKGSKPVIPEGTKWETPSLPRPAAPAGDVFAHFDSGAQHTNAVSSTFKPLNKHFYGFEDAGDRIDDAIHGVETPIHAFAAVTKPLIHAAKPLIGFATPLKDAAKPLIASSKPLKDAAKPSITASKPLKGASKPLNSSVRSFGGPSAPSGVEEESGIGSNNWAISGTHTASGKPILCNDPHLALNLPSLWYEMQLTAPGINAYGASLPGAPGIVIGFNEKISWGFTNNYRDVKDFYEITPVAGALARSNFVTPEGGLTDTVERFPSGMTKSLRAGSYMFCGKALPFQRSIEIIKVKGGPDVIDTVLYTIHGPVTYDPSFPDPAKSGKLLACTWMGHRGSNELLATYLLNRAGDYPAFTDAISHFECPAQNIAYADGAGNIAMWAQGRFINKWKDQGKYVMRGDDSTTLWGSAIPWQENPHVLNPPQGYVASANQQVTDSTYPYWYNQSYTEWRSWEINEKLADLNEFRTQLRAVPMRKHFHGMDSFFALPYPSLYMDEMQNSVQSELMWRSLPLGKYEHGYDPTVYNCLPHDFDLKAEGGRATAFQISWGLLYNEIWSKHPKGNGIKFPSLERTLEIMLSDSASKYYDDPATQKIETLRDIFYAVEGKTLDSLDKLKRTQNLDWYRVKNTSLTHLAKIPAFSYDHLKIGGWSNTINAATGDHGPSWRMIVEMDSIPRAYAIYPGGQSGNPGSPHYGDFVNQWVEGKYHAIRFLTAATTKNPFKYTWTITP